MLLAALPIVVYAALLCRRSGEGGELVNFGKMILFMILTLGDSGPWAIDRRAACAPA